MKLSGRQLRWFVLIGLASLAAVVIACGGDSDDPTATSQPSNSGNPPSSTGNPLGALGLGGGDGSGLDCSALTAAGGIPDAALSFLGSDTPSTDFARQISDFFTDVIEEALSLSADVACFFEVSVDDEGAGVWMAFSVSDPLASNAVDLLTQELMAQGVQADSSSSFTADFGQGAFSAIGIDSLPNIDANAGGVMLITGDSIVVAAGSDFSDSDDGPPITGGGSIPDPTGGALTGLDDLIASAVSSTGGGGPTGGASGTPTATPAIAFGGGGTVAGVAGDVSDELKAALEAALGVSLELGSNFTADAGGSTTAILTYTPSPAISGDVGGAFGAVVTGFGGNVDFTFSTGGATTVTFSESTIAGFSVDGSLSAAGDLSATLQITPG